MRSRRMISFGLAATGLTSVCMCLVVLWPVASGHDPARYPGSLRLSGGRLNLAGARQGVIAQDGAYHTPDPFPAVWEWYTRRIGLEASRPVIAMNSCHSLQHVAQVAFAHQAIGVTLCSRPDGTLIMISRTILLR